MKDEADALVKGRSKRTTMCGRISIGLVGAISAFGVICSLAFGFFFQKALAGFTKQVNAFVEIGGFGSIPLQAALNIAILLFILYLVIVYVASVRHTAVCGSQAMLLIASISGQMILTAWVLLMCVVSSATLVYSIFIGSIYSFCAMLDQQCFDFKVLIPAIVNKFSNKKIDMSMCKEKQELLCAATNNQFWPFMAACALCLMTFVAILMLQNFVVCGLGRQSKRKEYKHVDAFELK